MRAIELDPSDPDAWTNRGAYRGNLGDIQGAEDDYTVAIELDPTFALAYANQVERDFENTTSEFQRLGLPIERGL